MQTEALELNYVHDGDIQCMKCGEVKPRVEYYDSTKKRNGKCSYCKPCHNASARASAKAGSRSPEGIENRRRSTIRTKYGLDWQTYDRMMDDATHCPLCGDEMTTGHRQGNTKHMDHCHETGRVRGVLCARCNMGVGYFKDDLGTLQRAIEWVQGHGNSSQYIDTDARHELICQVTKVVRPNPDSASVHWLYEIRDRNRRVVFNGVSSTQQQIRVDASGAASLWKLDGLYGEASWLVLFPDGWTIPEREDCRLDNAD